MIALLKLWVIGLVVIAADSGDPTTVINYANKATGVVLLIAIVWGSFKGWWVPGYQYRKVLEERDQFLDLALKSQEVSARAMDTAEKVIK